MLPMKAADNRLLSVYLLDTETLLHAHIICMLRWPPSSCWQYSRDNGCCTACKQIAAGSPPPFISFLSSLLPHLQKALLAIEELTPEEQAELQAIRDRKIKIVAQHRRKKSAANNHAMLPQKADRDRKSTTQNMRVSRSAVWQGSVRLHKPLPHQQHEDCSIRKRPSPTL